MAKVENITGKIALLIITSYFYFLCICTFQSFNDTHSEKLQEQSNARSTDKSKDV